MSRRGPHVYLKTDGLIKSHIYAGGGFEIKGEGTYVVAPPSLHPSGIQYQWLNPEITEILFVTNVRQWVKERALRIGIKINGALIPQFTSGKHLFITPERNRPVWVSSALSRTIPAGERNLTCFKLACYLFKHYPREQVVEMVLKWAKEKCKQPPRNLFKEDEVTRTLESAYLITIKEN